MIACLQFSISHLGVDVAPHMPMVSTLSVSERSMSSAASIWYEFGFTQIGRASCRERVSPRV